MDEAEVKKYNEGKKGQKIKDITLTEKDGMQKLTLDFEGSEKLSKSGKNKLIFYNKEKIKGKTVQITIYEER